MTNHPRRMAALAGYGIEIIEHVPMPTDETREFDLRQEEAVAGMKLIPVCA